MFPRLKQIIVDSSCPFVWYYLKAFQLKIPNRLSQAVRGSLGISEKGDFHKILTVVIFLFSSPGRRPSPMASSRMYYLLCHSKTNHLIHLINSTE